VGILKKILGGPLFGSPTAVTESTIAEPVAPELSRATCMDRLRNMKAIGFAPGVVFDCGASVGYWSWEIGKLFPETQIFAFEPNPKITPQTRIQLSKLHCPVTVVECAIGVTNGTAVLNIWDNDETKMSGSSIKNHVQGDSRNKVEVELKTLDSICAEYRTQPVLIKLDLQGYELDALRGSENTLKTTEAWIIEFGCLQAYIDRTTPNDLMQLMYENDYVLYDVVDLIYRPYDNALTGGDFFFIKNSSKLKSHKGYS
jgi:FkbM family methyltransferase